MKRLSRPFAAALSGILLAAAFSPAEWWPLAYVALVPLIVAAVGLPPRRAFLLGWIAGVVFFSVTVWWVTVAIITYGGLPAPLGWALLLLLSAYLGIYPGIFAMAASRPGALGFAGLLLLPAAWTALEWFRGTFFLGGFPWGSVAYTQFSRLAFIQSAALGGPHLPGFILVAVNVALAWLVVSFRGAKSREWSRALAGAGLAGVAVAVNLVYGSARLAAPAGGGEKVRVAVLQGNISQDVKWNRDFRESTMATYEALTRRAAADGARVILWPEAAAPFYLQKEPAYRERIAALAREAGVPLLVGAPAYELEGTRFNLRNRVYLFDGMGREAGVYDKMHLVPFGEYVPAKKVLSFAGKLVAEVGDFTPGPRRSLFDVDRTRFGTVICYEIVFPDLVRRFVDDGAGFMATVTNDAWYGRSSASRQHFAQMVFRAVENARPVARAANTGISGFVDARGRILLDTPLFVQGAYAADLAPSSERTPYSRWGDWFAWLCVGLCAAGAAARVRRRGGAAEEGQQPRRQAV
jgi:apolipoprotein N-acyltransferase